jgi:hypothetical protein
MPAGCQVSPLLRDMGIDSILKGSGGGPSKLCLGGDLFCAIQIASITHRRGGPSKLCLGGDLFCAIQIASLEDFCYCSGSRFRTHRNLQSSPEITDQDDVARFAATGQRQLFAIT